MKNILLLGLGGGCVIATLREDFHFRGDITAVEIDGTIIEIANDEFGLIPDEHLAIIHADASDYIRTTSEIYDLIIIDLFIDTVIPADVYTHDFWKHIRRITGKNGYFLFNASISTRRDTLFLRLLDTIAILFSLEKYEAVRGTNTLLIGKSLMQ